jgi:prevent-host-death family protein
VATSRKRQSGAPAEIGVRELKNQASRILRSVQEDGVEYIVTVRGNPVAVLRSLTDEDRDRQERFGIEQELADMTVLAGQIAANWRSPHSAVDLVSEQRRPDAGD